MDWIAEGGCTCGSVRYRLTRKPLFVQCCHCRWCQRESGSSFAVNGLIEDAYFELLSGVPLTMTLPSESGMGQTIDRCPTCRVTLWGHYYGAHEQVRFVRMGTLDNPDLTPPDIHIFTSTKQPWVVLPPGIPAVEEFYDREEYWPPESLARRNALSE